MPASSYVLIKVEPSKAHSVYNELKKLSSVVQVDAVTGPHDMIAIVESPDVSTLGTVIINKIRTIDGVNDTLTCHIIKFGL
ncbi:Lrp/AsnC ligand binding domain-containing protein [candidate division WOR-3 bacterium]|nr:Lrp/AsnC ligand binding domain-containing protein [candidate division WOR-3 bacterium]MCK4584264.1 Lrp/AsnC ligand binding domain-containing protein [candidate division WOR-3 bacterium]TET75926.1 MAG: Lrp/AsnC family transcriptional regulator [Candidatus Cloacimonadota bacterium]